MKKLLAWALIIVMLAGLVSAAAEEEVVIYDKLLVSVGTPFSGNFFSDALGNNISDLDVRNLIHGYNLVNWDDNTGSYQFNSRLISAASTSEDNTSYVFALFEGLTYNDGTPITAKDYAFSLLLQGSPEFQEATGGRIDLSRILGGRDYQEGKSFELKGVRILGDYQFALLIDPEFMPYFYQLKALDVSPLPISVIAPDCEVKDDGKGAYIDGDFTADLLEDTLMSPIDGYVTYPKVTSGPYMLTSYADHMVELDINPNYIGDENGIIPSIPKLIIQEEDPNKVVTNLAEGKTELAVRVVRQDQIKAGMQLAVNDPAFAMKAYSRTGVSFISFCAEKGPTSDVSARQALTMCLDRVKLTEMYTESYGLTVDGPYGIGQWMFLMANGTLIPEDGAEEEWADLSMDAIRKYEFDPKAAAQLLEDNGWEIDRDGVYSKAVNGQDVSMHLKLFYPEGNGAGPMLKEVFVPYLEEIGIELEIQALPMPQLLEKYYGQAERDCDMILIGTNFGDVYDPSGEYDENGKSYLTGITDPELRELAINMRSTEPGNATEYCRRWLAYQGRLADIAAEIPLYSDVYFDFHITALQRYAPASTGSWSLAIPEAVLSDYMIVEEEEEEEEFELVDDETEDDWTEDSDTEESE